MVKHTKEVKGIGLKIIDFNYVDGDLLCVTIEDDRGERYHGTLERKV